MSRHRCVNLVNIKLNTFIPLKSVAANILEVELLSEANGTDGHTLEGRLMLHWWKITVRCR